MIAKHILERAIKEAEAKEVEESDIEYVELPIPVAKQLLRDIDAMDERIEKVVRQLSAESVDKYERDFGAA